MYCRLLFDSIEELQLVHRQFGYAGSGEMMKKAVPMQWDSDLR